MPEKKQNPWLKHLASVWKKEKGKMTYKECMLKAKQSYKKK